MILYFNPGHETAVLNGSPYYTAPANIVTMQNELSYLPAWYGATGDVVLVDTIEIPDYYQFLYQNLEALPMAITDESLSNYSDEEIILWGISPQSIYYWETLAAEQDISFTLPIWNDEYTFLNSRLSARNVLNEIIKIVPEVDSNISPQIFDSLEILETYLENSSYPLLAKALYSSSGRGLLWLPPTGLTRTERQILHGILKKQGNISVERVLDKQVDFAMEFMSDGKGNVSFEGYSLFYTNKKGGYEANFIGSQNSIENILTSKISNILLDEVKKSLLGILAEQYGKVYKGCIGVDMMIYKDGGVYKLHPCLEINMRYNMGYLALKLYENYVVPSSSGKFFIEFSATEGEIMKRHQENLLEYPISFADKRLKSGYLALCPISEKSKYRACVVIENER